jgi:signal transduction histidine kinase
VQDLRSPAVGNDLTETLEQTATQLIDAGSLELQVSTEGVPRALGDGTAEEVRRIAEEALRNVVHHAQAHSVQLLLAYRAEGLALTIRDDGIGLDAMARMKKHAGHFGCAGMRERAQQIGARLDIANDAGGGTVVELFVPAKHAYLRSPSRLSRWWPWRRSHDLGDGA